MTTKTDEQELLPCPFCGAGTTEVRENGRTWLGTRWGEPVSVSVRHWCESVDGQPSRMIERVGRDRAAAINAWNRRAALQAQKSKASDAMLSAVIRMPYRMAMGNDLSRRQFYQRAQQALNELEALQSQATEAFPCRIVEADFETGTVTLEMHGKYTVSSGHKYLCDAPLQSQNRGDVDRIINAARSAMDHSYEAEDGAGGITIPSDAAASLSLALDEFDHARRIEEDGE